MANLEYGIALLALLAFGVGPASSSEEDGAALLKKRCGRCHGIREDAKSKLSNAPNLWDTLHSYPTDRLEFELAEGIGSRHPAMPQIQFTLDEIALVKAYLGVE
jgi:mono/diheme cytochrome c family protein